MEAIRLAMSFLLIGSHVFTDAIMRTEKSGRTQATMSQNPPPTQAEKDEVDGVWNMMKSWGGQFAGVTNIGMYMSCNTMSMIDTNFSFSGIMPESLLQNQKKTGKVRQVSTRIAPAPSAEPDETKTMKFGPLELGKYLKDDSMTMQDSRLFVNKVESFEKKVVIAALAKPKPSLAQVDVATPTKMYMYTDELSMNNTIFTMNIGEAAAMFLQESGSSPQSSTMSLDEMNINMFMYGNEMTMTDTQFTMDVNSLPISPTTRNAGIAGGDLARLLLLNMATFGDAVSDTETDLGSARDTPQTRSVWDWLQGWSTSSQVGSQSANINMHMYDNKMSMDKTVFKMNVGTGASGSLLSALDKTFQASNRSDTAGRDWRLYNSAKHMEDTVFTMEIGSGASLLQQSEKDKLPPMGPGSDISMYMYNNNMRMDNTKFTMNVGNVASLLQTSASSSQVSQLANKRRGAVMNIKRLNVRMYMYENAMSMTKTIFSWTVG